MKRNKIKQNEIVFPLLFINHPQKKKEYNFFKYLNDKEIKSLTESQLINYIKLFFGSSQITIDKYLLDFDQRKFIKKTGKELFIINYDFIIEYYKKVCEIEKYS